MPHSTQTLFLSLLFALFVVATSQWGGPGGWGPYGGYGGPYGGYGGGYGNRWGRYGYGGYGGWGQQARNIGTAAIIGSEVATGVLVAEEIIGK
ncbi:unnamed protein product [Caenorhabditis sp. 36 PRJEB53466]|nr:unnamed protein product [Caenorhabditis sp. 36 PRJEB53466]